MLGVFIAAGVVIYGIFLFNRMVALRQTRNNALSDIDVQLKQRHDLVPNLIATIKRYTQHEQDVFENVTQARAQAMAAKTLPDKDAAESALGASLFKLAAVAENYPQLKADALFLKLQGDLGNLENSIAAARRFLNNATNEYNSYIQQFPGNLVAGAFGFRTEAFFSVDEKADTAPVKVTF